MIDLFKRVLNFYKDTHWDISLYYKQEDYRKSVFLNGKKERINRGKDSGVMISIAKDGKVFRQASPTIDEFYLKSLIDQSIKNFNVLEGSFLSDNSFQLHSGEIIELNSLATIPLSEINKYLIEATKPINDWVNFIRASLSETQETRVLVNSKGGVFSDQKIYTDFYLDLMGSRNGINQNRSNGGVVFQGPVSQKFLSDIEALKESLYRELEALFCAPACPKMTGDLILPSDQMYIQIHESIGHPLELDRILGDERNYAGGSFVERDDFGKLRYGPDIMNVVFAPNQKSQPVAQQFDDTGMAANDEYLIKNGVLMAGIGGAESQKRSGLVGTSSTRCSSWNRPPIDRMGNINLLPGKSSLDEMVTSVENGILMKTNRSWSIDDQRDKFQFGCEVGYLIKDGVIKHAVRDPNYEGRTVPFWNSLKMVGASSTVGDFGTSNCGKGEPNQAIRVGHQSPACLFSQISIFPGA
jgi:predicted Zn-dependent protease